MEHVSENVSQDYPEIGLGRSLNDSAYGTRCGILNAKGINKMIKKRQCCNRENGGHSSPELAARCFMVAGGATLPLIAWWIKNFSIADAQLFAQQTLNR